MVYENQSAVIEGWVHRLQARGTLADHDALCACRGNLPPADGRGVDLHMLPGIDEDGE
jgi:hypothetical protein